MQYVVKSALTWQLMQFKGINWGGVEEEAVANWSKRDFLLILTTFDSNWW